ncbi:MAG: universal stress protein [Anaerolineales bacterium]
MYKRILVPLDGSPLAEAILPHAEVIAKAMEAEIILLYVIPGPAAEFSVDPHTIAIDVLQDAEAEMKIYLKNECSKVEKEGFRVTYLIREGIVVDTILDVAQVMQANMIAMSTHGRTGALRLLFGSVTEGVVHQSPLPVLVIRPKS